VKESDIEQEFIKDLVGLKYIYRDDIKDREALEQNFRSKFEELNDVKLTDPEFDRLLNEIISSNVYACSKAIRKIETFKRDDGSSLNYNLVNIDNWCKNTFEVINQLRIPTHSSHHQYDVVLLMNGLPVVQIELKNINTSARKAMRQIALYKKDKESSYTKTLMCFLQFFIVSNRTNTEYFSNNNPEFFEFDANERYLPIYMHAERDNTKVNELDKFTKSFLPKCVLGETINKYMVLIESKKEMLMMRPYQVYAVKSIVDCIKQGTGNGYIWHTTGSGKTLTSFKAATLLKDNDNIQKCLFVVDRKDLDRQTREEFNKFQEGCVEENTNTQSLVTRLLSEDYKDKIIVTTIQKLGLALSDQNSNDYRNKLKPLNTKKFVFIFDECHRSQFGDNHEAIVEFFPNSQLFGFTGTPIFDENSNLQIREGKEARYVTTESIFQQCLHEYTITHAIEDENVLKFHVDYFKFENESSKKTDSVLKKKAIVNSIIDKHSAATKDRTFNALFATGSINDAIEYYNIFTSEDLNHNLNVACVFSPPAEGQPDIKQIQEDLFQELHDNSENPDQKKEALANIIEDYNKTFETNHNLSDFDGYYKNVQRRIKNQEFREIPNSEKIDITIVVDMLLTGFDSKYLKTLYLDKNLRFHSLIQAFSRTNRVLNKTKPHGTVIDYRGQQERVKKAIKLFSGEGKSEEGGRIWIVDEAPTVIKSFGEAKKKLDEFLINQEGTASPETVPKLKGETAKIQFTTLYKEVKRLKVQLDQYTDLTEENEKQITKIITNDEMDKYSGVYIDIAKSIKNTKDDISQDDQNELIDDLDLVLFGSDKIDYDYIMELVSDFTRSSSADRKVKRDEIINILSTDSKFIDDREDIEAFVDNLKVGVYLEVNDIKDNFADFKIETRYAELEKVATKHNIDFQDLKRLSKRIIDRYIFEDEYLSELIEPMKLSWSERTDLKQALMIDLVPIFNDMAEGREITGLEVYEETKRVNHNELS
jgi:type I restriction enzyme R subunit